jgi:hypothetical protein
MLRAVKRALVLAAAAAVVGVPAAAAQAHAQAPALTVVPAVAGYQVVQNNVSLPAGGFVRQAATCPTGKVVFGGGAAVVGAGSANFATEVQESSPGTVNGGAQSIWLAAVSNHSSTNYTLGIFAVCGTAPAGYQVVQNTVGLPAGGFVRQAATCPTGKVVLAGGPAVVGDGSANFGTEVQESSPGTVNGGAQSIWLAAVSNHSSASYTLGIFALCASM